jgi:hypothetical protein
MSSYRFTCTLFLLGGETVSAKAASPYFFLKIECSRCLQIFGFKKSLPFELYYFGFLKIDQVPNKEIFGRLHTVPSQWFGFSLAVLIDLLSRGILGKESLLWMLLGKRVWGTSSRAVHAKS